MSIVQRFRCLLHQTCRKAKIFRTLLRIKLGGNFTHLQIRSHEGRRQGRRKGLFNALFSRRRFTLRSGNGWIRMFSIIFIPEKLHSTPRKSYGSLRKKLSAQISDPASLTQRTNDRTQMGTVNELHSVKVDLPLTSDRIDRHDPRMLKLRSCRGFISKTKKLTLLKHRIKWKDL